MECKNCSTEFQGNYCPECGQKASVKRFSTKIVFNELIDKIIPLDKGVLFTARHLLTRPGAMLREYLAGKRALYTKPLQFLLILVAISLIFFSQEQFLQGMEAGMTQTGGGTQQEQVAEFQKKLREFISSNLTLLILGMIPFLALTGRWFYKKHDINYAEHFIMNCYLMAGCTIISLPFTAVMKFMNNGAYNYAITIPFFLCYLGYFMVVHLGFFREKNRIWNAIKAALTFIVGYVIYILATGILGVIAVFVYILLFGKAGG